MNVKLDTNLAEMTPHVLQFDIFPAIHLRDGKTVDFTGKDPDESAIVDSWRPLETAQFWIDEGANWIHVVDVDAMFQRDSSLNWQLITQLCELPVKVQLVGGHFSMEDLDRAMQAGVQRVLLDASQPDINMLASTAVAAHGPESLGVIFTTRAAGKVGSIEDSDDWPTDWAAAGGAEVVTRASQLYHLGITTGVHVTVAADGSMSGCDAGITQELASLSGMNFLVGGEVYDMNDVVRCYNRKGVTGILIGRALYNGNINLQQALRNTRRKIAFESGLPGWKQEQDSLKARLRYSISKQYLQGHLPERSLQVLDAGGGNGLDALYLAGLGHEVSLLDESMAMLADFEEQSINIPAANHVTTCNANIRDIPKHYSDEQFDLVLCHNVIQYVNDWESILRNAVQPLKSGGVFSLITRNRQALPYQLDVDAIDAEEIDQVIESFNHRSAVFDSNIMLFTPSVLVEWLQSNGFQVLQQYGILSLHHYANVADQTEHETLIAKLEHLEYKLGQLSPHRDVARYVQLVAVKS